MKRSNTSSYPVILFLIYLMLEVTIALSQKTASIHADGVGLSFYKDIIFHPWIWMALSLGLIQVFLWVTLLSKTDLSLTYSLSSLSYPIIMFSATFLFKEHLSPWIWLGCAFITLGVILVGTGSKN